MQLYFKEKGNIGIYVLLIFRKGRAGRLKPGESYHLITREEYDKLHPYPIPELLKTKLDKVIISSKIATKEKICDFFDNMINPPKKISITHAINNLINFGILDKNEDLTSLGKRVSQMSFDPKLSKAVVLSCVFQYVKIHITDKKFLLFHSCLDYLHFIYLLHYL